MIYDRPVEPSQWHGAYISTYLEHDVRQRFNLKDIALFQRFLRSCANHVGQLALPADLYYMILSEAMDDAFSPSIIDRFR